MCRSALNDREKNEEKAQIRPQKVLSQVVGGCGQSHVIDHMMKVGIIWKLEPLAGNLSFFNRINGGAA